MSWPESVIATASTIIVFVVAIVAIWQGFKTWQTRIMANAELARDDAYRTLAERAAAAQQATAEEQRKIAAELAELRARVGAIEQLLREVG